VTKLGPDDSVDWVIISKPILTAAVNHTAFDAFQNIPRPGIFGKAQPRRIPRGTHFGDYYGLLSSLVTGPASEYPVVILCLIVTSAFTLMLG